MINGRPDTFMADEPLVNSMQAVALDLGTVVVGAFDDAEVKRILTLAADEQPLCLMPVGRPRP